MKHSKYRLDFFRLARTLKEVCDNKELDDFFGKINLGCKTQVVLDKLKKDYPRWTNIRYCLCS